MSHLAHHEPAILQEPRRHRYLKLIALFKIGKGVLLLLLGVSLLFLNARTRWMDALSNWTADEILLEHSKAVDYLLNKLQAVLSGGTLRALTSRRPSRCLRITRRNGASFAS